MWIFPAVLLMAVSQADVNVKSLDNSVQRGRLAGLTSEEVVIEVDGEKQTLLLEELMGLNPVAMPAEIDAEPAAWINLDDGSEVLAKDYTVSQGAVKAGLLGGDELTAKTSAVRWARFKKQSEAQAAEWAKIVEADAAADLIVIRKDERIDYLEGVVEDITAETVNFRLDGDLVPVRREKVEGVVYFHPNRGKQPTPVGVVHDASGSHFNAASLELAENGIKLTTASGAEIVRPLSAIRQIDFSAGKIAYLSDLQPRAVEWTPFFGSNLDEQLVVIYQPRMNSPISNDAARGEPGQLQLRKTNENGVSEIHTYSKGIALHSRAEVTWLLPDEFRVLKAIAGIDARYRNLGHVELIITGDGEELFRGEISGQDEPLPLEIDLTGVRRLTVLVDFGKNLDLGDHLNLCNARVVK